MVAGFALPSSLGPAGTLVGRARRGLEAQLVRGDSARRPGRLRPAGRVIDWPPRGPGDRCPRPPGWAPSWGARLQEGPPRRPRRLLSPPPWSYKAPGSRPPGARPRLGPSFNAGDLRLQGRDPRCCSPWGAHEGHPAARSRRPRPLTAHRRPSERAPGAAPPPPPGSPPERHLAPQPLPGGSRLPGAPPPAPGTFLGGELGGAAGGAAGAAARSSDPGQRRARRAGPGKHGFVMEMRRGAPADDARPGRSGPAPDAGAGGRGVRATAEPRDPRSCESAPATRRPTPRTPTHHVGPDVPFSPRQGRWALENREGCDPPTLPPGAVSAPVPLAGSPAPSLRLEGKG